MKKLIILLFICSQILLVVATSVCPPGGGIVCYPNDCSNQYQKCNGDIFNDPENTPAGFKCSRGHFVFSSFCLSPRPACPVNPSCSLSQVLSENDYLSFFPQLNGGAVNKVANQQAIFNYSYLISAAKRFPAFACTGKEEDRKREVAAFLGQTSQETSGWWGGQPYSWGYYFSTEIGCTNDNCKQYCKPESTEYPCVPGKSYFGRGPIQLSWNYNYGQFSQAIYGDKNVLLNNPDLIFEGDNAFLTALWFWMTPQMPKPSCHDVIIGTWEPSADDIAKGRLSGFGMTTNIINGALECSKETPQSVTNRVAYFSTYAEKLGVAIGPNLFCNNMTHY